MVKNQSEKNAAAGSLAAEPKKTSTPTARPSQTKEDFAQELWHKVKLWVQQKLSGVMDDDLKMFKVTRETMDAWCSGADKSVSTTMHFRNRVFWMDTHKIVSLVREVSPHAYWQDLAVDKSIIDAWCNESMVDPEMTMTLLRRCKELCVRGVLYEHVKQKLGVFRTANPDSFARHLRVDLKTLDEWDTGVAVTFEMTNDLRLRLAEPENSARMHTRVQMPESDGIGAMQEADPADTETDVHV
jgi:hypothetical protein